MKERAKTALNLGMVDWKEAKDTTRGWLKKDWCASKSHANKIYLFLIYPVPSLAVVPVFLYTVH